MNKLFLKNILLMLAGTLAARGAQIIALTAAARFLTIIEFGEIGVIRTFLATASIATSASFATTATRYVAASGDESDENYKKNVLSAIFFGIVIVSMIMVLILYCFQSEISVLLFNSEAFSGEVFMCAFVVVTGAINAFLIGVLAGHHKFPEIAKINFFTGVAGVPVIVYLTLEYKLLGMVVALSLLNILTLYMAWLYSDRDELLAAIFNAQIVKNFISHRSIFINFSGPSFLTALSVSPILLFSQSLLLRTEGGAEKLGVFIAAANIGLLSLVVSQVVSQVIYPYVVQNYAKKSDIFEFKNLLSTWLVGMAINFPAIIFSNEIMAIYGEKYVSSESSLALAVIALTGILQCFKQGIGRSIAAVNRMWLSVQSNLVWAVVSILIVYNFSDAGVLVIPAAFLVGHVVSLLIMSPRYFCVGIFNKKVVMKVEFVILFIAPVVLVLFVKAGYFELMSIFEKLVVLMLSFLLVVAVVYGWFRKIVR